MSGADRKSLRAQALAALDSAPFFAGYTAVWAWSQTLDARELPIYVVAAPQERKERDSQKLARCDLTMIVTLKKKGGEDIEDDLDLAGDAAESTITGTLRQPHIKCELSATEIKIDGSGEQRVGVIPLIFGISYWVEDPAPYI